MITTRTKLKPKELLSHMQILLDTGYPFMVVGRVGIGKTSISKLAATQAGCQVIVETPHLKEPTDYHGYPFAVSNTKADFLPIGTLHTILNATHRLHVVFDELDKAATETMNAVAQLILQREVNGRPVPDCVTFSATGNLRIDRSGSNVMPTHLVDRFACIFELEQDIDQWSQWALQQGYPLEFIAFNRFRPEFLLDGQKTDLARDLIKTPTPRTLATFGELLKRNAPTEVLSACAGLPYTLEYQGFLKLYQSLPDIDGIFLNPQGSPVPKDPASLYALSSALAKKVTPASMQAMVTYLERMPIPYQIATMINTIHTKPECTHTAAYTQWAIKNSEVIL